MVDLRVDRGRRHPGVPQDLADLGERRPGSQHLGCQAVAEPVRAGLGTPDRSQALYTAQATPLGEMAPIGALARRNTALVCASAGCAARRPARRRHRPAAEAGRPGRPCRARSARRTASRCRPGTATRPRRRAAPGAPAASASRNPGARAGSAGRSLPAAWPPWRAAAPGAGLVLSGSPRRDRLRHRRPDHAFQVEEPQEGPQRAREVRRIRAAVARQLTSAEDAHRCRIQRRPANGTPGTWSKNSAAAFRYRETTAGTRPRSPTRWSR